MSILGNSWRSRAWPLVIVAVLAAALVACSSDDNGDAAPAATNTQAAATGATGATGSTGATGGAEATATTAPAAATTQPQASVEVSLAESDLGSFLVGPDGRTLYVFTRDAPDTTNCTGNCLEIWPPLLLEDGEEVAAGDGIDGAFGSIDTLSGTQVTYNQTPLYYFASDAAAGDTAGHLVGNVWFVARPDTASTSVIGVSADEAYLVGPTGMTLYLFANDTAGTSNCSGTCLENWPALTVPEGLDPTAVDAAGGALDVITRDDGAIQVTYDGLPVYYFIGDMLPGETNGDGVGGVWSLATP